MRALPYTHTHTLYFKSNYPNIPLHTRLQHHCKGGTNMVIQQIDKHKT
jgi:hypothetical protein